MDFVTVGGKNISRMSLGTVQLGMNYGINNTCGQPDEKQSFSMLSAALENGISSIDTARVYGNSEEVLGRFFSQYEGNLPYITTKIPDVTAFEPDQIEREIVRSAETSLEKLGLRKVDNLMLHAAQNLIGYGDRIVPVMESLVKRGLTDTVGVSVYTGEDLDNMLCYDVFTSTQVPMSIFDQRLIQKGYISRLKERGITVFVRSVFMQGLFFMDPERFTDRELIDHAAGPILKIREYAEREGMTVAELAIAFIRDLDGVASLVIGADTEEQVRSDIHHFQSRRISEKTLDDIRKTFENVNIPKIMEVLSRPKN